MDRYAATMSRSCASLRMPQEEAMMRQRFGADYDAYGATVGRRGPRS
ncbi:hypothetical protein [Sphingomonas phyllosphaerae]|nr:hypothetical protein [Sphingomonas phyllosphaerae]